MTQLFILESWTITFGLVRTKRIIIKWKPSKVWISQYVEWQWNFCIGQSVAVVAVVNVSDCGTAGSVTTRRIFRPFRYSACQIHLCIESETMNTIHSKQTVSFFVPTANSYYLQMWINTCANGRVISHEIFPILGICHIWSGPFVSCPLNIRFLLLSNTSETSRSAMNVSVQICRMLKNGLYI